MKTIPVFSPKGLEPDARAIAQIKNVMRDERAVAGALMADHHVGYSMPIGGVVKYDGAISPTGVGFDIACGNMAVQTDIQIRDLLGQETPSGLIWSETTPEELNAVVKPLMRQVQKGLEFGVGRSNPTPIDHALFDDPVWQEVEALFGPKLKEKAREQLGTVGSGNHYVDLLVDGEGWVWVANHFGSRGFGWTIGNGFIAHAQGKGWTEKAQDSEEPAVYATDTELGALYVAMMRLAGEYAYAGREYVISEVLRVLGGDVHFSVHNHHNFAWFENGHWVVRKGATPLSLEPAFIGGSMGDVSVIVRGRQGFYPRHPGDPSPLPCGVSDIGALGSAPHGAGRVMSRTAAAGKVRTVWQCTNRDCSFSVKKGDKKEGETLSCPDHPGGRFQKVRVRDASTAAIDWDHERGVLRQRGITVLGGGADEAPGVYKPLTDVILAHENIEILYTLRPIGVVMAGPDTYDPYRD